MTKDEEFKAIRDFNAQMAEEEKEFYAPVCHFTPMSLEQFDYEEWWACPHCGHTKEIKMMGRPS